ncbi:hypothetical protein UlMin_039976 [Ulmus minor]
MAIASFGLAWRSHLNLHRFPVFCARKQPNGERIPMQVRYRKSTAAVEPDADPASFKGKNEKGKVSVSSRRVDKDWNEPEWKKFNSKELGIKMSSISKPTLFVLSGLRKKGYDVYLVGGCVRDLILKRTPKDFDIITNAELKEVKKTFLQCEIVGKRFPICHVHVNDTILEVSSFSTCGRQSSSSTKYEENFKKPPSCSRHDYIRWRNCLQRDFTINGLMFDPYTKTVYDYMGGVADIRKAKVRTVIPANISFVEDCARILRGIRIAARLGFRFTKDIALSVKGLGYSVRRLDKGRILMEMNYMLAFGSSEASVRLLWRFGLLEMLLPIQASYFASQGFRRRDERSNMLLSLFTNLDKFVAPNQPCDTSLWIAILAFHKALDDQPQDPLVVAAFALAVDNGGCLWEAVKSARKITQPHDRKFHEILEPVDMRSKIALVDQVVDLAASVKIVLRKMTDRDYVSQAMIKFPKAPRSDLVFIPMGLLQRVYKIFDCIERDMGRGSVSASKIRKRFDYESMALGNLPDVQHLFAKVVLDTVYPANRKDNII